MKRILWFRRDLRAFDNPLFSFGGEVLPIFIFDENILKSLPGDDKRVHFIYFYLQKLKAVLQQRGLDLKIFYGKPDEVFDYILAKEAFDEVVAGGDYDAYARQRDIEISLKIHFRYIYDTYLFKPKEILIKDGAPYLVFTPFYQKARASLEHKELREIKETDHRLYPFDYQTMTKIAKNSSVELDLKIESIGFQKTGLKIVDPHQKLEHFLGKIDRYAKERDFLDRDATSHLDVDLRFGTIGIRELVRFLFQNREHDIEPFLRQLLFREFYAYLLFHFPNIEFENFKYAFNGIKNAEKYRRFCEGKTGVPLVDAGIRELLQTGYMHNRARMVVASFFTKDLLLPWQWGEAFFARHLLDFDKASNVLSWQWSAGTGVDPQPYFRVFNPYLQSKKFDKEALYIKKFVPELQDIQAKQLHDEAYLLSHVIDGYPKPIVKHKEASKKAITLFKSSVL
jgi:deoxyribodipyrimidine photo-lyase